MSVDNLLDRVKDLSPLELVILLSLVAQQHCLIVSEDLDLDHLALELSTIVSEVFGLSCSIVEPQDQQAVAKFGAAILDQDPKAEFANYERTNPELSQSRLGNVSMHAGSLSEQSDLDRRMVANVVIAKNFNHAHRDVQIATLELIRRRRIFSRTTVHPVPQVFLFIPLTTFASRDVRLNHHLLDRLSVSYLYRPETQSAVFKSSISNSALDTHSSNSINEITKLKMTEARHRIDHDTIESLRAKSNTVHLTPTIRRYMQDIVVSLRMERGVDGGVSPYSTTMLILVAKSLAPLYGFESVTTQIVTLAVQMVYPHRISISTPDRERSVQWHSDPESVRNVLKDLTPEIVIDRCLSYVQYLE